MNDHAPAAGPMPPLDPVLLDRWVDHASADWRYNPDGEGLLNGGLTPLRRSVIRRFVTDHYARHGQLPSGVHRIRMTYAHDGSGELLYARRCNTGVVEWSGDVDIEVSFTPEHDLWAAELTGTGHALARTTRPVGDWLDATPEEQEALAGSIDLVRVMLESERHRAGQSLPVGYAVRVGTGARHLCVEVRPCYAGSAAAGVRPAASPAPRSRMRCYAAGWSTRSGTGATGRVAAGS